MTPTLDEVIDSITDAWMTASAPDFPDDAAQEAVEEYWAGCRQEVEVFLAVLCDQPAAIRSALIRLLQETGGDG